MGSRLPPLLGALIAALAATGAAAAPPADCTYAIHVDTALVLDGTLTCVPGVTGFTVVEPATDLYLDLDWAEGETATTGRFRLDLGTFAAKENDRDSAQRLGRSVLATGGAWLLRPLGVLPATIDVTVTTDPGVTFATGLARHGAGYRLSSADLRFAGYSAFGKVDVHPMPYRDSDGNPAQVDLAILDGDLDLPREDIVAWARDSLDAAVAFWHGLPAPRVMVALLPRPGRGGVPFGRVMSGGGVSVMVLVGQHATPRDLADDWVFIHEMIHVGQPFVRDGMWFTEGQATYLEPLIRVRWKRQTEAEMWREFVTRMPGGVAVIERTGMQHGGWRGMYYGGAVLMMLADITLRRASQGRIGVENCFRGAGRELGPSSSRHSLRALVEACDRAVGSPVMAEVVARYGMQAGTLDLEAIWRDLGVAWDGTTLTLDDTAPLAWVRRSMIRGGPDPKES